MTILIVVVVLAFLICRDQKSGKPDPLPEKANTPKNNTGYRASWR